MKAVWLKKAKTADQKKDVKVALQQGRRAFEQLEEIVKERIEASYTDQRQRSHYEDPNWAVKQADFIGCQRTYKEILDLITDIE